MCISGIFAFTNTSIFSIKDEVNTGAINIELKEYTLKDGQELIYTDSETTVLPGQIISLIPRITNLGDSSYVRAKLTYTSEQNSLIQISDDNVDGINEDWVKKGEYWYYKNIVNSGENIDIFKTLRIPIDVPNEFQGKAIQLNITAEAIQSNNFNPNFDSNTPWGGVNVEEAKTAYQADMVQINPNAVIEYENSANIYMSVPENFFNKLGHIVPGDIVSEDVSINNKSETRLEYFVSTDKTDGISEKEIELLEKLQLKIVSKDGVIYNGNAYKIENCSLGVYEPNSLANLKFIVTVPSELGNEFADLASGIKWNFSVKEVEKEPEPEPKKEISPQTGDTKFRAAIMIFLVSAMGLIVVLFLEKKQKDKNK